MCICTCIYVSKYVRVSMSEQDTIYTLILRRAHCQVFTDVSHTLSTALFVVLQYCIAATGLLDSQDLASPLNENVGSYVPFYKTSYPKTLGFHQN